MPSDTRFPSDHPSHSLEPSSSSAPSSDSIVFSPTVLPADVASSDGENDEDSSLAESEAHEQLQIVANATVLPDSSTITGGGAAPNASAVEEGADTIHSTLTDEEVAFLEHLDALSAPYSFGASFQGAGEFGRFGSSVAVSGDGQHFAFGMKYALNDGGDSTGAVQFHSSSSITTIYGESSGNEFGFAVSMSLDGRRVAVGAPKEDNSIGAVRVFEIRGAGDDGVGGVTSSSWELMGDPLRGEDSKDSAGFSVALSGSGDVVAVGTPRGGAGNTGSVIVYRWLGGNGWTSKGQTIYGDFSEDMAGYSVSLSYDGMLLAVGFSESSNNGLQMNGHVRVYSFNGFIWERLGPDLVGETADDHFGSSVALSSNGMRLVVGSDRYDLNKGAKDSGYCAVYDWKPSRNDWTLSAMLAGEESNERAGMSAAISFDGDRVACGGSGGRQVAFGDATGVVRVLMIRERMSSVVWPRNADGGTPVTMSRFGSSVALSNFGETLVAGAPTMTVNGNIMAGSAQVFRID